jgi:ribosomal protein S24E
MENITIQQKENQLFNRKEIQINLESEITPTHQYVEKLISEKFSTSPENINIKNILGRFGSKTFTINADVYSSKKDKENAEHKSKKEQNNTEETSTTVKSSE